MQVCEPRRNPADTLKTANHTRKQIMIDKSMHNLLQNAIPKRPRVIVSCTILKLVAIGLLFLFQSFSRLAFHEESDQRWTETQKITNMFHSSSTVLKSWKHDHFGTFNQVVDLHLPTCVLAIDIECASACVRHTLSWITNRCGCSAGTSTILIKLL